MKEQGGANLKAKLLGVRAQAVLVRTLRERQGETARTVLRARRMDGMPSGGGVREGLDAGLIRREEMERILLREEAALRRMEKKARAAMDGMKAEMYAFCALYYIGGMSVSAAAEAIDRSERQCMRYKRKIERGENEGQSIA